MNNIDHPPSVWFADATTSFSGVIFVLFCFVFVFMVSLKPRPFVQSSFDFRRSDSHTCFFLSFSLFLFIIWRCRFFLVFLVPLPLSLCMESTSYVLSFRMVFFYRYAGAPIAARVSFFLTCVYLEMWPFPSIFVPLPLFLCMESTSYVLSFRMVFFYLVNTGWIFYISLRDNSINQINHGALIYDFPIERQPLITQQYNSLVVVGVFFTRTDRASTIPSNIQHHIGNTRTDRASTIYPVIYNHHIGEKRSELLKTE